MYTIKILLWVFIVQMLFNPFTVYVVAACILGPMTYIGVVVFLVLFVPYFLFWRAFRMKYDAIDRKAMEMWVR